MMKKIRARFLAYILSLALCVSSMAPLSFAADAAGNTAAPADNSVQEPAKPAGDIADDYAIAQDTTPQITFDTPPTALKNVALGKTATASESEPGTDFTPNKAVDGVVNRDAANLQQSRWGTNGGAAGSEDVPTDPWLMVDLGEEYDVESLTIEWERDNVTAFTVSAGVTEAALTEVKTFSGTAERTQTVTLDAPVSARYVKLTVTAFNDHNSAKDPTDTKWFSVSMFELEVYAQAALKNVAQGKTASAKTEEDSTVSADKAVDGSTVKLGDGKEQKSRWGNALNDKPTWFQVDLGKPYDINQVAIYWERHNATNYKIQLSDTGTDGSWTDAASFTQAPVDLKQVVAFDEAKTAQYVRLWIESYDADCDGINWDTVSIFELEVYAPEESDTPPEVVDPTANLALNKTATANGSETNDFTPAKAVDGSRTDKSRWASSVGVNEKWLQVDLGKTEQVQKFVIWWERRNVKDFDILLSNNGTDWETAKNLTGISPTLRQVVMLDEQQTARYVRLRINDFDQVADGVNWATVSVWEFEVYSEDVPLIDDVLSSMTIEKDTDKLVLPEVAGYTIEFVGADYEQVIGADQTVYHPIVDTNVTVSLKVTQKGTTETLDVPTLVKGAASENTGNAVPQVVPELREWVGGSGDFAVTDGSKIVYNGEGLAETAQMFAEDYKDITGSEIAAEPGKAPSAGDFYLTLSSTDAGLGKEGYRMTVDDAVTIEAAEQTGAFWGTRTVLQILKQTGTTIPKGTARDYPKFAVRTLSMDVGRKPFDEQFLDDLLKNMTWYKMNDINLHLSDNYIWLENYTKAGEDAMDAYSGFRLESSIVGENGHALTSTDEAYSKNWMRQFIQKARRVGVNIVPEFDTPAHSLALTKTEPSLRKGANGRETDHLNLVSGDAVNASAAFTQSIWDEYVTQNEPVFDAETVLNVGTDEYSGANEGFRSYMDKMFEYVQGTGRTVRAWGSLSSAPGSTPVRAENVQLNMWYPGYANPKTMYDLGYNLISIRDNPMYIVPGASYYNNYINTSARYSDWTPYDSFDGIPAGSPQVIGGGFACWNDLVDKSANGMSTVDVYDRIADALPTVAEKTWGEGKEKSYNELRTLQDTLGDAPNSNPRMEVESKSDTIARYRCETTEDSSGNGYNMGTLTNAALEAGGHTGETGDSALRLNGGASSAELPIGTVGPNSIECWVKQDADASGDQTLFESEKGSVKVYASGKVGFTREEYGTLYSGYTFDYTLPKGEWVKLRFSSELGTAKLYVNDTLKSTLSGKLSGGDPMASTDWYATMYLPLDRIGSETASFKGLVDQITVYRGTGAAPVDPTQPADKLTVTFDASGGSAVAAAQVDSGSTVAKPGDPTREGYTFGGWYTTFVPVTAYDFSAPVTASMTLYARWIKGGDADAPAAHGPTPTDAQLSYHQEEMAAFVHFGPNTFKNLEWGDGTETVNDFNPTNMTQEGVNAWVQQLKDAGFKRLMMVGKHHDGFCMWDSAYTEFDSMNSPFGKDVMEMVSTACTRADMGMGFYISPWDMHEKTYGTGEAYNEYYNNQLTEVLSNPKYGNNGKFVEVWMDGAKGEGKVQEYDFDRWFDTIHEYQPDCLVYTDRADGGIRWSGNERGITGDPTWQRMDVGPHEDAGMMIENALIPWKTDAGRTNGKADGTLWSVCECDVSLHSGWFYHADQTPKTMEQLADIYFNSVGLGSVLLLNVPPDKTGNFSAADSARVNEFGSALKETYAEDFVKQSGVTAAADQVRGDTDKFGAAKAIDGSDETYWTMNDGQTTGALTVNLGQERTFDMVSIKEYIALGQRISGFKVEYRTGDDGQWKEFATGTTIGQRRLVRSKPVTADQIKISITASQAVPLISDVGVFKLASAFEIASAIPEGLTYVDDRAFTASAAVQAYDNEDGIGGTHTGANTAGVTFTGKFTGSQFYVMGIKDPGHGKIKVTVDGKVLAAEVDTNAAARKTQTVLYTSPTLTQGEHTVVLEALASEKTFFDFDGIYYLNNGGAGMFELDKPAYTMAKDDTLDVTVRRVGGSTGEAKVKINTLPGTAVQGQYYEEVSGELAFADGETEKTVTLKSMQTAVTGDMYFFFAVSEPTNGALIGFQPKTTVTISANAAAKPQQPKGGTFTAEDPFVLPEKTGAAKQLEAEYSVLQPGAEVGSEYVRVDNGPGDGKHIGWFEPDNSIVVPYTAAKAGKYTLTLCYASGRSEGTENKINWRGDNVTPYSGKVTPSANKNDPEYITTELEFVVTQAGDGMLEFYADASACPNIDYMTFTLTEPVIVTYTVTFDSRGGSAVAAVTAEEGEKLTKPADPTREGYAFGGWYKDEALTNVWNFNNDTVTANVTLYAKWTENSKPSGGHSSGGSSTSTTTTTTPEGNLVTVTVNSSTGVTTQTTLSPDKIEVQTVSKGDTLTEASVTVPEGAVKGGAVEVPAKLPAEDDQRTAAEIAVKLPASETPVQVKFPVDGLTDGTVAVLVNADGTEQVIRQSITEDGALIVPLTGSATIKIVDKSVSFTDVPQDNWAAGPIAYATSRELFNGMGNGRFEPDSAMSRAMLATVLYRYYGEPKTTAATQYSDVPADRYYSAAVAWASKEGIVKGTGAGFLPDDSVTREQLMAMLYRAAGEPAAQSDKLSAFADAANVSAYARDAAAWAAENGIVNGVSGNRLAPRQAVSRAEVAAMLQRFARL